MRKLAGIYREMFKIIFYLIEMMFILVFGAGKICMQLIESHNNKVISAPKIDTPTIPTNIVKTYSPSDVEECYEDEDDYEELRMQQMFPLTESTSLIVDHVELCPEETVFIRVLSEEAYSQLYKRKVYKNKIGDRYFKYNNQNMFLDDEKTQPIVVMEKSKKK